ncbi:MAG: SLBB domain-containing protein [Cyanobacteriota bacterium]|nr:SLBB domain-containing protein [Cyanobacteriota bacterium]
MLGTIGASTRKGRMGLGLISATGAALLGLPLAGAQAGPVPQPSYSAAPGIRSEVITPATDPALSGNMRYRLGPGDRLKMSVFRMQGYETAAEVLSDGTLSLPRLGSVPVWGLTLDEARARITTGYGRILRRPIVYLDLLEARPVRVSISGEVQRPGLYSIGRGGANQLSSSGGADTNSGVVIQTSGPPTLLEAIQKAGGLTSYGDLRRLTVQRRLGGPGSPVKTLQFDFWNVLSGAGPVTNPLLYDGDSISIPRADNLSEPELLAVASSTFAPDTITVNVVGEVIRPGTQNVKANSPLSGALLSAGGLTRRASETNVRLLRLLPSGAIKQAEIRFSPAAPLGSPQNPPLQQGDVVVVDRHRWAKATDSLSDAVQPIGPIINASSLLRILGLGF